MNDKEIRKILISFLKTRYKELRIYQEKQIGGAVCDLMMVTECLTGFEIKSDLDNYSRIANQVNCYDKFFDCNYIVVGDSHRESVVRKVPEYWGIMVISSEGISVVRLPQKTNRRSVMAQLSILWKLELKNLLNYFSMPIYAQKDKKYISDRLSENVPEKELSKQIAYELMNRDYSIYDAKDYTEYYRSENDELGQHQLVELVDSISEMDMSQMTLDQWINIYREAREIQGIKEKMEVREKRPVHAITYEDIEVAPGVPWISAKIIEDFIKSLSINRPQFMVVYEPITGNWFIHRKKDGDRYPEFTVEFGIKNFNALFILESLLNLREIKIYDSKRKYDEESTVVALEKQDQLLAAFKKWIWEDENRKWEVEEEYNRIFNKFKLERFDGSNLVFPEMKEGIELFDYQKDAARAIMEKKNTLLAFDVGAGKTYIMIAAAMLMRQQGISRKNMFVVPNNIVGQWEKIFTDLYPKAKLLVIEPKSFKTPVREKTMNLMKCGDFDGIIIASSCFDMIPLSVDFINESMKANICRIDEAINQVGDAIGSRAALDRAKKNIMGMVDELISSMEYDSVNVSFDELGINTLFVDEAHNYKNIPIKTHMKNIRGINTKGSKKCLSMLQKVRCIQNQNDGRGVVFATGTPLCNSIADAYTMQFYLYKDELELMHLDVFDNWVKTFARPQVVTEIDVDTQNYRMVTRFATFHNLPELSRMFSQIAIFHAMGKMDGIPNFEGYTDCVIGKNKELSAYMETLAERTDKIRSGNVNRKKDNMLKISTDGRKAALDLRLVGAEQSLVTSKVFNCANKIIEIYHKNPDSSQLVFCDYSTPKKDEYNVYKAIKELLVQGGIKEKEIAFIHSYHSEMRKVELFNQVNEGKVKVLIGSTFKLGIGANVQTVLKAIHHVDVPWRPADMVQREGRILRNGNKHRDVLIFRYISEGSFDAYSWQILESKQRFISQFLSGAAYQRSTDDLEENVLNYAEVKALALADSRMKDLAEKENKLANLRILSGKYKETIEQIEEDIKSCETTKNVLQKKIAVLTDIIPDIITKNENDFKLLRALCQEIFAENKLTRFNQQLGSVWEFEIETTEREYKRTSIYLVRNGVKFLLEVGDTAWGNATRVSHFFEKLPAYVEDLKVKLAEKESQMIEYSKKMTEPNPYLDGIKCLDMEVKRLKEEIYAANAG